MKTIGQSSIKSSALAATHASIWASTSGRSTSITVMTDVHIIVTPYAADAATQAADDAETAAT
jgi:hypothetical protein